MKDPLTDINVKYIINIQLIKGNEQLGILSFERDDMFDISRKEIFFNPYMTYSFDDVNDSFLGKIKPHSQTYDPINDRIILHFDILKRTSSLDEAKNYLNIEFNKRGFNIPK